MVDNGEGITRVLGEMKRIAVIGIKTMPIEGPAFSIPQMLQADGFDIVPVPVYYPDATEILDRPVHRSLETVSPPADLVLLFRRAADIPDHVPDILAARPRVVWMQQGIRNASVAEQLAKAGIDVVQDRCIATELHRRS
jgi:uncharacterized protein